MRINFALIYVIKTFETAVICVLNDVRCPAQSLNPPFVGLSIPEEKKARQGKALFFSLSVLTVNVKL